MASDEWRDDLREIRRRRSRLYFDGRMMDYRNCVGRFDSLFQDERNSWEILHRNRAVRSYLDRALDPVADNKRHREAGDVAVPRGTLKRVAEPGSSSAWIKNVAATTLNFPPWPFKRNESVGRVWTRIKTETDESDLTASLNAIGLYQTTSRDATTARRVPVRRPTPPRVIQHLPAVTVIGVLDRENSAPNETTEQAVRQETVDGRGEKSSLLSTATEPHVVPRLEKLLRDWMDSWLYEQVQTQLSKLTGGARSAESGPPRDSHSDASATSSDEPDFEEDSSVNKTSPSANQSSTDPSPPVREDAESEGSRSSAEVGAEVDRADDSADRSTDEADSSPVSSFRLPSEETAADSYLRPNTENAASSSPAEGSEDDADDMSQSVGSKVSAVRDEDRQVDVADANEDAATNTSEGLNVTPFSPPGDLSVGEVCVSASRGPCRLPYSTGGLGRGGRLTTIRSAGENSESSRDETLVSGTSASCSTCTYSEGELTVAFVTKAANAPSRRSDPSSRLEGKSFGEI